MEKLQFMHSNNSISHGGVALALPPALRTLAAPRTSKLLRGNAKTDIHPTEGVRKALISPLNVTDANMSSDFHNSRFRDAAVLTV